MYLKHLTRNPEEDFLLFCFPYAGSSAYLFNEWLGLLPRSVGLWGINYWPKDQDIENQAANKQLELIAHNIAQEIAPLLDRPFAFFGHSMGALVAYEVNRLLSKSVRRQAEIVFISSSRAPHRALPDPLCKLDDENFCRRIIELKGLPPEIIHSETLLKQTLSRLRKDFNACENYRLEKFEAIASPLKVIAAREDNLVELASIEAWRLHAGAGYSLTMLSGNHFYIHNQKNQLISLIKNELGF